MQPLIITEKKTSDRIMNRALGDVAAVFIF
jgi:hypothetical protein